MLCDLDGVVWLAHQPISGAAEGVAGLRAAGVRVLFVTNNSSAEVAGQEAALAAIGIPATGDVITSATAAADLVQPAERVLVVGGPGVTEAVVRRGATPVPNDVDPVGAIDVVMVGFHREFDYERLRRAATAALGGARLIATNDDPTYPTPSGPIPGGGALVAAVAAASGMTPVIAGKPHRPMADTVLDVLGGPDPASLVMVGDRDSTDGAFARTLGCPFALVRSGVTPLDVSVAPAPDIDRPTLGDVVEDLLRLR